MNGGTRIRDLRLVPRAIGVWGAALACVFLPGIAWWCAGAAVLVGVLALGAMGREGSRGGLLVVIAFAMAAASSAAAFAGPTREAAAMLDGRVIEVVGTIASSSATGSDGRAWFDAQSSAAGTPGDPDALSVPVRIGVERVPGLEMGAFIRVTGQAMATDRGERAAVVVFGTRVEVLMPAEGIFGVAAQVREDFVARAVRLPDPGAGLLPGLAVGDTRAVTEELNDAMLTSGLSHLTAVSGKILALLENRPDLPCKLHNPRSDRTFLPPLNGLPYPA